MAAISDADTFFAADRAAWREWLAAEPAAAARWRAWAASHRRQYTYWVLDAKRPETRARRVAETVRR